MIIVWMPKGRRKPPVKPEQAGPMSAEKAMPKIAPVQRKRTTFVVWGRNPFVWPKVDASPTSGFTLSGIIWDEEAPYALINGTVVHAGDEIAGKKVKRIEPDKVILTDGLNDNTLRLP